MIFYFSILTSAIKAPSFIYKNTQPYVTEDIKYQGDFLLNSTIYDSDRVKMERTFLECSITVISTTFNGCYGFDGNKTSGYGGAIWASQSQLKITDSMFLKCLGQHGGAIASSFTDTSIDNSKFISNPLLQLTSSEPVTMIMLP